MKYNFVKIKQKEEKKPYQIHTAKTLLFYFLMQKSEGQMIEPKQTSHLQISMKVETELILGFLFEVCEIHQQVPRNTIQSKIKYKKKRRRKKTKRYKLFH